MKWEKLPDRIAKFLKRHVKKPTFSWSHVSDPRSPSWVRISLSSLLNALLLGMLAAIRTLRDLEDLTECLCGTARALVPARISDTSLHDIATILNPEELHHHLVMQVREMHRSKSLKPDLLPCGVLTVDGKTLATLAHDANGMGQRVVGQDGRTRYYVKALRGTLTSARAKPCIFQTIIDAKKGEVTTFDEFFDGVHEAYGRADLFELCDVDAGFTNRKVADTINGKGYGYVMGLKGNQPELLAEAQRLIIPLLAEKPEAETPWEKRDGTLMCRRLYRTREIEGYYEWSHLRQAWLVRQITVDPSKGAVSFEERFFISSILWNYLTPLQILLLVRNHWGVENNTFNSLDQQWREDFAPWCTKGNAIAVLAVLRLMAYNLVQYLRSRHLCRKNQDSTWGTLLSWRFVFMKIFILLVGRAAIVPANNEGRCQEI